MLVAFSGAGISVASGLPTFDGSFRGVPVREILESDYFYDHTAAFYEFYSEQLLAWPDAEPNAAHLAIACAGCPVVTQNIDGLHQKAGSARVIELHGNLRELRCESCGGMVSSSVAIGGAIPRCPTCAGLLKPVVVLFGEGLPNFVEAYDVMRQADQVLVVGTSLTVQPAAGLVDMARARGAMVELVNARAHEEVPAALARLTDASLRTAGPRQR